MAAGPGAGSAEGAGIGSACGRLPLPQAEATTSGGRLARSATLLKRSGVNRCGIEPVKLLLAPVRKELRVVEVRHPLPVSVVHLRRNPL